MKILLVCTGNSCRSQMAEGIMKSLNPGFKIFSAGIKPEKEISRYAVKVLKEIYIDISGQYPKDIEIFKSEKFDYVITFSESAKDKTEELYFETKKIHFEVPDPFEAHGNEEEIIKTYRNTRDIISDKLNEFVTKTF